MTRPKGPKPKRPEGFPLFPHASGTWAAKIGGKHKHFGPWSEPKAAYKRWQAFMNTARYGTAPPPAVTGSIAVETLANRFLTEQHDRAQRKEIGLRSFKDQQSAVTRFVETVGENVTVGELTTKDFSRFRDSVADLGADSLNRNLTLVKQMFIWGFNQRLYDTPMVYGSGMKKLSVAHKRRNKKANRLFTPGEVRQLIDTAKPAMKAMILLGINCGFGNTDCASLTQDAIDFKSGIIDFPRPKTGIARRCAIWPETSAALKDAIAVRPRPVDSTNEPLVFLTTFGVPWVREKANTVGGVIQSAVVVDSIGLMFGKLMEKVELWTREKGKVKRDGRGFYTLRHTYRTLADDMPHVDQHAILLSMGHLVQGMSGTYVGKIENRRLHDVSQFVRGLLFEHAPPDKTESPDLKVRKPVRAKKPRRGAGSE